MAAVTEIRHRGTEGRAYYEKKIAEGMGGKAALRKYLSTGLATAINQKLVQCPPRPPTATREPVSIRPGTHAALEARDIAEQAHGAQQYDLRL